MEMLLDNCARGMTSKRGFVFRVKYIVSLLILLAIPILPVHSHATVDWSIYRTLKLEAPPLDVAISRNGNWIFVLTDQGDILIFSGDNLVEKIKIGDHVDEIEVGPREELLLLKSRKNKTLQVVVLDFVKDINVSGSPFKGASNAPVTIAIFSDFQCDYCKELLPLLEKVLELYPEEVKLAYKNFPLKKHTYAKKAAIAALAAHRQGMFWEFHDLLFDNSEQLSDTKVLEIASELGLDQESFKKEMGNPKILSMVQKDLRDGQKAGVRSVPTIFVNGRLLKNRTLKGFRTLIDGELEKLRN